MAPSRLNILVHTGTGTTAESVRHCMYSLRRLLSPNYAIIPINETALLKEPWAQTCALLVFPGGADLGYCRVFNGEGNRRISEFVRRGGAYLGLCAGGYYGSSRCEFEVGNKALEVIGSRELGFFPGTCRGGAFKGFEYKSEKGARAATIKAEKQSLKDKAPGEFAVYYNGGGVFVDANPTGGRKIEVLASYKDDLDVDGGDEKAAVVLCHVGEGKAILSGPHPEFAPANLNAQPDIPGYSELVDKLAADDNSRTSFLKALLSELGLEVVQDDYTPPSLSSLHLTALESGKVTELLCDWGDAIEKENGNEYIRAGDVIPATVPGNRVWTLKEPVGVCGLITPWNFPAAMITRKIGPALAAGCTVVCKAPGETPFTALALAELAHRAGIPKGVVNIVTTLDNTVAIGELLTTHPTIKKVSFTGSTGVGKLLMKQSSATLKKLSLELGGNSPFIVFDDADLDTAVTGAITSKFRSSGQTCVCANRIYVQEGIYEAFVTKFVEKVKQFKVGNGFAEGITHGPLIHERAISKVDAHVQDAVKKGAKLLVGGQKLPDVGPNFFQLTVLRDMKADMAIASEETFGPVAGLFPFKTEAEVVQLANNSEVGLAGYFFSRDLERVHRVAEALEVGMIGVNTGIISDPAAPFGGVKESGFGREGSKYGIAEYQITKMITYGGMGKPLQS